MATLSLALFNETDGSTSFSDEIGGITISQYSGGTNAETDNAVQLFSTNTLLCPANEDAVGVTISGFSSPHAGDFTVEYFLRHDALFTLLSSLGEDGSSNVAFEFGYDGGAGEWFVYLENSSGGTIADTSGSLSWGDDTTAHVALVREGTVYSLYWGEVGAGTGTRVWTTSTATNVRDFTLHSLIAALPSVSESDCWFDCARVSNSAQYTGATYTIPTAEFALATHPLAAVDTTCEVDLAELLSLVATDSTSESSSAFLFVTTPLVADDSTSESEYGAKGGAYLTVPEIENFVATEDAEAVTKPAVPNTSQFTPELANTLEALKQNVQYITGRQGGKVTKINPLEPDIGSTPTNDVNRVIAKLNEVIDRLMT